MNVTGICGSLREASLNKKLLANAMTILSKFPEVTIRNIDLKASQLPLFNEDIELRSFPELARELSQIIALSDAIVISSPEYNGSISSPLKNFVDWISRTKPQPFFRKKVMLMSASPGALGGIRGLQHTRMPFDNLGCFVFPEYYSLPQAHLSFEQNDEIKDPQKRERLAKILTEFMKLK